VKFTGASPHLPLTPRFPAGSKYDNNRRMEEKPLGISLVLCDQIMTEIIGQKCTLVGVFSSLYAHTFPATLANLCVFAQMTNGRGRVNTSVRCIKADTMQLIGKQEVEAEFNDPTQVLEQKFVLRGLVFPQAGVYSIDVFCDEEQVMETRFQFHQLNTAARR